ncbi:RHS repeat-associated core domain-containing protein [Reinekea marinisedimentorum]|uniref:RHS repeat-associated protein n=1 Tax=Reinekea marinisedimentorum TaxID=230495 RepID=A0A4R3I7E0_9GAMM|nr:RHS repeat-associated core domain-containing protein [Reinekea marinisedimentorum]TCS41139.1 RHS repeat-associated protein [Reinekea marinisedimentorum]
MNDRDQLLREQFSETGAAGSTIDPSANSAQRPAIQADKNAAKKLPNAIKEQLRSHISDWSLLNAEVASGYRSGEGIQFFEQTSRGYRKVNGYCRGSVCLVSDGWLKRVNNPQVSGSSAAVSSYSNTAVASADEPEVVEDSYSTTETNHQIEFYIANPDGDPMPDARYSIVINGQTYSGALDENGEGISEYLPEGEAEITIEPNLANLDALRSSIQQQFDGLVNDAQERQAMLDDLLFQDGFVNGTLIIGCIWAKAVWNRGSELTSDTWQMIKGTPSAVSEASAAIWQAMKDKDEDGVIDGYAYLVNAAGELKSDVERLASVSLALMKDEAFWDMLMDFCSRYYDAMSAEDKAKMFGGASFDLAACFIGAAALAKVATAAKTIKTSTGVATVLAGSRFYAPAVKAIKRIAHIYDLAENPLKKKLKVSKSKHKTRFSQSKSKETLPDKKVVAEENPARTDTGDASERCASTECLSDPISMVTGEELYEVVDFSIPGPVPVSWKRTYRSTATATRSDIGYGWSHPWAMHLDIEPDTVWLRTEEGLRVPFSMPDHGATHRHPIGSTLTRFHDSFTLIHNGQHCVFEPHPFVPSRLRLVQIGNEQQSQFWKLSYSDANNQSRLVQATSSWGEELNLQWNDHGIQRIYREQEEGSTLLVRYLVDDQGDLIAARQAQRPTEQYRYNNHLFVLRQTGTGIRFVFEWDQLTPKARCTRQASSDGHYDYQFDWDYKGETPADSRVRFWNKGVDSNGIVELFGYDDNAMLLCHMKGDGGTEYFYYDGHQQLIKHINAEGQSQHYSYDHFQRLQQLTDVTGQKTHFQYLGRTQLPVKITNSLGQKLAFEYDHQDRLVQKTFADGKSEQYRYDDGKLSKKIDPFGRVHHYQWHPHWGTLETYSLLESTAPGAATLQQVNFLYDDQGRLASQTDSLGNEQHFVYDEQGQLITRSNQHGQAEHFSYDKHGRVIAQTDSIGRTTQFQYGRFAQLEAKTLPDGSTIQFEYDRERNLVGIINPNGAKHRFSYDACERIQSETTVDGRTTQYQYNKLGHLTGLTDGSIEASFQRDALGKLLSEHYRDANRPEAEVYNQFKYDDFGQLVQASNAPADIAFKYNEQGQLIEECSTHTFKGAYGKLDAHRHESHFHYNAQGLLEGLEHKAFKPETPDMQFGFIHRNTWAMRRSSWNERYDWHKNGALAALHIGSEFGDEQTLLTQQINDRGQLSERTQGQHTIRYGYDAEQRLQQVQRLNQAARNGEAIVQERSYQYDAAGRISTLVENNQSQQFFYNEQDHLTGINEQNLSTDPAGNRLPDGIEKLLDNRLPFWCDRHYEYDAWGNIVKIKRGQNQRLVQELTYNAKHQLVKLIETKNGEHKHTLTFSYDALGRRIRKEVFDQNEHGQTNENYRYAESYIWRGNQQIQTRYYDKSKRCKTDQAVIYQPGSHTPLAILDSEAGLLDIDTDHLGTPKALYEHHSGEQLWRADHDTYGALKNEQSSNEKYNLKLRFQGQYEDAETGLYYNFNRYYDPHAGRYINHDPIGLMGGLNQYQYCPNPVGWVDPLGLACKEGIHTRGYQPASGERSLTKEEYKNLISGTRGQGAALQSQLLSRLSSTDYVYRATTKRTLEYYRSAGRINRDAYMTFDDVGLDPAVTMDKSQVFEEWGKHEVLLKIPTSEVTGAKVPRPFGNSLEVGWEPTTEAYPAAGSGGNSQFLAQTTSWDESWVIPMK